MYRDGSSSGAELLLQSRSLPDFLTRLDFISTIGKSDADLAAELAIQRDTIENQAADLQKAELSAQALEFDLKARQIEIQGRIAERQQLMASAQSDLLALLGTESARRQIDEATLLKEILAGAASVGVTVTPGSPVETALAYHGIPYVWGGATPAGFDCSGLTMYVYAQHGVILPHHAADQYLMGTPVAANALMPGDLVFFGRTNIYHVGMYIGGGYFVQAPRTGDFVKVTKLSDHGDYAGARRYNWRPRTGPVLGVSSITLPGNLPAH
jgi:cell wall-associated NlpC family hydrolase